MNITITITAPEFVGALNNLAGAITGAAHARVDVPAAATNTAPTTAKPPKAKLAPTVQDTLPTPGTSSSSTCSPASNATNVFRTASIFPSTTASMFVSSRFKTVCIDAFIQLCCPCLRLNPTSRDAVQVISEKESTNNDPPYRIKRSIRKSFDSIVHKGQQLQVLMRSGQSHTTRSQVRPTTRYWRTKRLRMRTGQ